MQVVPLQRTMGKFRGVPAPGVITLMDSVAMLQRKPVRARSEMLRLPVSRSTPIFTLANSFVSHAASVPAFSMVVS